MTDIYKWLFGKPGKAALDDVASSVTLSLPDELAPFAGAIEATGMPCLEARMSADPPAVADGSQLGGYPWWPADKPYPTGDRGTPLFLLAQLDLAAMPALPPLPRTGLLQVFIGNDDLYGCNVDNILKATGFRAVLHTATSAEPLRDFAFLDEAWSATQMLPLDDPLKGRAMDFVATRMPVDVSDYRFPELLAEIAANEALTEAYFEWISQTVNIGAIRVGGYPTFTQDDPRKWRDHEKYRHYRDIGDFTLLTVDTTDGIMWGDSGAAQFLAHAGDIERGDVSRVVYNWDCL